VAAVLEDSGRAVVGGHATVPNDFAPTDLVVPGDSFSQETKWFSVFHLRISHPTSLTAVIAVMTSMPSISVRSVSVMRNSSSRKLNCGLPFFFLRPPFRVSSGRVAPSGPILWSRDVLCQLLIAFRDLFLAKLVSRLFLLQDEQLILLPVALQSLRDLFLAGLHSLAGLHPAIPIRRQFPGIALPIQNRLQDGLPGHPADVADHVGQLDIHLRQRLLHALNVATGTPHQILALPPHALAARSAAHAIRLMQRVRNVVGQGALL
jgi:hypothetical protein